MADASGNGKFIITDEASNTLAEMVIKREPIDDDDPEHTLEQISKKLNNDFTDVRVKVEVSEETGSATVVVESQLDENANAQDRNVTLSKS